MKNKTLTKFLSAILAVVIVLCAAPLSGFVGLDLPDLFSVKAEAAEYTDGDFYYSMSYYYENGVKKTFAYITSCVNATGDIVIPETLGGYLVKRIDNRAFYNCTNLTSIAIPDSVIDIGNSVFYNCTNLTSVTIPDSVTNIGGFVFSGCTSLKSITIPDSVISIGGGAFENCTSLTSVTIGTSVTSVYYDAFYNCTSLTDVYYTGDIESWCGIEFDDGYATPLCYAKNFYINNTLVKEIVIPNTITEIKDYTFSGFKSVTSVTISDSVTSVGNYTFSNCISLTSLTISDSVTSIGNCAFAHCNSLTSLTIGTSVTSIGYRAFRVCTSLTSVTIPDSVTSIGAEAFYDCNSLTDVYYSGTESQWKKISIGSYNSPLTNATIHFESSGSDNETDDPIHDKVNMIWGRNFENSLDYHAENTDSSSYNPELANMMAALSTAVYEKSAITSAYESLDFSECNIYDYDGGSDPHTCGYSLAFKKSDYNNDIICLVSVRGSSNVSDWVGNFDITTFEDGKHTGFAYPANRIYSNIQNYIKNNDITGTVKYFITGHSRGAAVGNLLAVKLMENGVSSANVYNYNFACPDVACKVIFPSYNNIFNLCNREDVVPLMPGSACSAFTTPGTSWGKFGKTYWFTKDAPHTDSPFADHSVELYLTFFDQQLEPSAWGKSFIDKLADIGYYAVGWLTKIYCPVDVIVTDSSGKEIAAVVNGKVEYYDSEFGEVIVFTDGDKKVIYVSGDNDFNVNLIATDDGEMTYTVEKYNLQSGETFESKAFENVKLKKGKQMYSPVNEAETTDDVSLFVVRETVDGEKVVTHVINEDGSETDQTGSFCVNNAVLDDVLLNYKNTTILNLRVSVIGIADYTTEYLSSNESVATVDEDGNVTAVGTGEAEITATVTDEYGNVVEDTCKVTVSYAWWQWLIIIFLFGWIWY